MIYEVPNKVLRWIGGPQESGHEESMLQGIRQQHDGDVRSLAQQAPTSETVSGALTTGQKAGQALSSGNQTSASASGSDDGGGAAGGPGGGAAGGGAAGGGGGANAAAEAALL